MEQQQVHPIPGLVDAQAPLPSNEGEPFTQFEQEVFQPPDQGGLQIGLRILVLEVEELQHIGVFDGIAGRDGIFGLGHRALGQHRRLVFRQRRALVELAADLPIQLAHAPAAAQGLGFIELARMLVLDRQQPHIGRPRQREDLRQLVQPPRPHWLRGRFARHCLANWPGQKKRPHLLQVLTAEATAELLGEVACQPLDQLLAITRAPLALLLGLHDAAANLPVAGRHQRIDAARCRLARGIEQIHDAAVDAGVAGRHGGGCDSRHRRRLLGHAATSAGRCASVIVLRRFATSSAALRTGSSSVWT
mmetsp:Transcript_42322/g.99368  ORF Transcript_42322/g.99368 Transcript_42322/m.99368 type:complete len:305 (-) Transcript_42322:2094-3008(-)